MFFNDLEGKLDVIELMSVKGGNDDVVECKGDNSGIRCDSMAVAK